MVVVVIIGGMVRGVEAIIQKAYVKVLQHSIRHVIIGYMKATWRTINSSII
jgi:hypothetical protein